MNAVSCNDKGDQVCVQRFPFDGSAAKNKTCIDVPAAEITKTKVNFFNNFVVLESPSKTKVLPLTGKGFEVVRKYNIFLQLFRRVEISFLDAIFMYLEMETPTKLLNSMLRRELSTISLP